MKIWIMRGLPACGKSTKAAELITASGNTVRINKDLLRTMLHLDKWTPRNEDATHRAARALATTLLERVNVIIDDTNLNPSVMRGWKDLALSLNVPHEVLDLSDVPVAECIRRDAAREKKVGYSVIANMALRYGLYHFDPDSVVLCDIDGTIADIQHRLHFVRRPEHESKDWKAFFHAIPQDTVREDVRDILTAYAHAGKFIVFVSARPEDHKTTTLEWLLTNRLGQWHTHPSLQDPGHFTVIMRRVGDHRPDDQIKAEMLRQHFPDLSVIHAVVDDRPRVIRGWQALGLNVIDVGSGVEF